LPGIWHELLAKEIEQPYFHKLEQFVDAKQHKIVESAHPSPLSARSGFFGSKPFSAINEALRASGKSEIDWRIPDV
jgi:uracil-DNA glycosylase